MASISFMKGKIYEALDNRGLAMDYYVQALHKSVYCFEALEALVQHEMLMAWEGNITNHCILMFTTNIYQQIDLFRKGINATLATCTTFKWNGCKIY